jgi:hypothetical protein
MYSPRKASNSGDVTDSDRKSQTVKHGQASSTQRGARMVLSSTLDGLVTCNTAGSGVAHGRLDIVSHLGAALLTGCPGFQTAEKTIVGCL